MNDPLFPAQAAARAPSEAALRADAEQREASDPQVSAFVSASAGSGKTKLLTDRLLRLMLDGADPCRIQCLTFTRAAAAEMALRLQDRLGRWVTMGDAELGDSLTALGVPVDEARLRRARALFALVLDLPGGMRIGTIHAFCQSLLRRFPLEAAISPHFQLIEEGEARLLLEEAREEVLTAAPPGSVALIAEAQRAEGFGSLVATLDAQRDRIGWLLGLLPPQRRNALRRALGASARTEEELLLGAVSWPGEAEMRGAVQIMLAHGSPAARERAVAMEAWLAATHASRVAHWDWWHSALLTAEEKPRAASVFAGKALRERHPELVEAVEAEQERVLDVLDQRRAVQLVEVSAALLDLAVPVLQRYAQRKREGGLLDYADMIGHTAMLLRDPGAAWVLYKLDGGLDHLLLDEVQDTSPEQWRIAHVLTEEFFAGIGRDDDEKPRTFFAVGDPKQSIYSFQGADPDEFDRSHAQMASRVRDAGQEWRDVPLDVSFRSTAPVLALVDAVFADPVAARGVVSPGAERLKHFANRSGDAGRVELWPLQPRLEARERAAWEVAERNEEQPSAQQALATELARWIKGQLDEGVLLPSQGRPLEAGDVLVLVQQRGTFAPALVRALKVAGVPVAGLDRLALREQLAVQDLLALCDALLLPGDDLQLACVLTSPLGGLSDDSLMDLALGRPGSLWEVLRVRAPERRVWADALRFLDALHTRADFATPHALLSEALGPLGGRARLLRRLGPEAAEPIDELLSAALAYSGAHPPSLQGFVHWMRASSEEVQRQAEEVGNLVRVMTVHGAKGLQARLVILPDTTGEPPRGEPFVWLPDPESGGSVPVWVPRVAMRSERVRRAQEREAEADRAERNRLLYVALTRAQDRLVVCGWEPARPLAPESWHAMVRRGFERLGAQVEPFTALAGDWAGERLVIDSAQRTRVARADVPARETAAPLPTWAGRAPDWQPVPLAPEPQPPHPIAASRPEGVELGIVPRTVSPLAVREGVDPFLHGRLIHALLQNLPDLPPGERPEAARAYAARPGFGLPRAEVGRVVEETLGVLADPSLAPLFGPGSRAEQPLVGVVDGAVVSGVADRVAVLPGEVLVADYKTDRDPPERAEDTPALYLGQLAAYRAVLAAAFPDRPVRCVLVWTRAGRAVRIPDALLAAHRPHA